MTKARIYSEILARLFLLLLGYLFQGIAFILTLLGSLGDIYTSAFATFQTQTKQRFSAFDSQLKANK